MLALLLPQGFVLSSELIDCFEFTTDITFRNGFLYVISAMDGKEEAMKEAIEVAFIKARAAS